MTDQVATTTAQVAGSDYGLGNILGSIIDLGKTYVNAAIESRFEPDPTPATAQNTSGVNTADVVNAQGANIQNTANQNASNGLMQNMYFVYALYAVIALVAVLVLLKLFGVL